jgi:hypothetical protein
MVIDDGQWRYECFFQAAERSLDPEQRGRLGDTIRLCLGADIYMSRCLGHISGTIAGLAPSAGVEDRAAWERTNRLAAEARRALAPLDPGLAERLASDMWARAMARAYSAAQPVSGNPLDVVEPAATPHVRAGAAQRLMALEGDQDRTSAEWAARLDEALTARTTGEQPPPREQEVTGARDLWSDTLPGEEALAWVPYIADAKRAIAVDPAADGLICLIEAAARDGRTHERLFAGALGHEDRVVRWTAARLLRTQRVSPKLKERVLADSDPLVRGRASTSP